MIKQPMTKHNNVLRLHLNQFIRAQIVKLVRQLKVLLTKVMGRAP